MSRSPVTLMVSRRAADGRYEELLAWLHEGEQLATDFPGYQGFSHRRATAMSFRSSSASVTSRPCMPGNIRLPGAPGSSGATGCSSAPERHGSVA